MRRFKGLLGIFAFSLLVLSLPTIASAQWGGNNRRDRDDDNYGRNNGNYNNTQLRNTVRRLKNDSKDFAKFLDNELDRGRYDDSNREDQLNRMASDFKRAADRLESRFDSRNLYRSQSEAQQVINQANQLDRAMRRFRLSYDLQNYWNNIQRQVNEISNAYRYNNGRGNNRNGSWKDIFNF